MLSGTQWSLLKINLHQGSGGRNTRNNLHVLCNDNDSWRTIRHLY